MPDPARELRALASAAADVQRSLEARVADVDRLWADAARRSFDADHLAAIRADARHLRGELEELARVAAGVGRQLRAER